MTISNDPKLAYVQGFLESALGSTRQYTADDLRRKMQLVVLILQGKVTGDEFAGLMLKDGLRQRELDGVQPPIM